MIGGKPEGTNLVISVPIVANLAFLAGTPGHPRRRVSLYYYAGMFLLASVAWIFVNPRRVIVYAGDLPAPNR
jgi:hypothetical protein